MLLRIGFVRLEIFRLYSKLFDRINLWWLKKLRVFVERKILRIILKGSQSSPQISGNLSRFAIRSGLIRDLRRIKVLSYCRVDLLFPRYVEISILLLFNNKIMKHLKWKRRQCSCNQAVHMKKEKQWVDISIVIYSNNMLKHFTWKKRQSNVMKKNTIPSIKYICQYIMPIHTLCQ